RVHRDLHSFPTRRSSDLLLRNAKHSVHGFWGPVNYVIDAGTRGYVRLLRAALGIRWGMILAFVAALWGTWMVFKMVPPSFVPDRSEEHTSELQSLTNLVC